MRPRHNTVPAFGQAHTCGGLNCIMLSQISPLDNWTYNDNIDIKLKLKKHAQICFNSRRPIISFY